MRYTGTFAQSGETSSKPEFILDLGHARNLNRRVVVRDIEHLVAEAVGAQAAVDHVAEVAQRWGRVQSRVSSLEADLTKIEVATLMDYVRALHGTLEVRITVDNHT